MDSLPLAADAGALGCKRKKMTKDPWGVYNYCTGFIDLLGQREEYKNEGLLPQFASEEERKEFLQKIRRGIGAIFDLQQTAENMLKVALSPTSRLKKTLPPELHDSYDQMQKTRVKRQRWSDGMVFFVSLGETDIKCPMNGVFYLFGLAASLCFFGLAKRRPLRGAIDIAWGVELHEGELYGAAVAKAYELESSVAQYPRIVVSDRTMGYLEANRRNIDADFFSQTNSELAKICLSMLMQDVDGYWFIHYLGAEFQSYISQNQHEYIYNKAIKFIEDQSETHRKNGEGKLAFRYSHLLSYFVAHPPSVNVEQDAQPGHEEGRS